MARSELTRKAKYVAETVTVLCPTCNEPIASRDGSLFWTAEDFRAHAVEGGYRRCGCGTLVSVKAPKRVEFEE